ncbi:hypothetical protein TNCT_713331 [Trichonephila clavata]|uniref:Uncharacterized protein n=1 Tax=Trichonephila clavata TaxID=2740835 RepID=A0A8X6KUI4_TRICU|nr:hypothetical protein TNCT_713331 [Trichonephila clavata]
MTIYIHFTIVKECYKGGGGPRTRKHPFSKKNDFQEETAILRGIHQLPSLTLKYQSYKDQRRSRRLTSEPVSGAKLSFIVEVCPGGSEDELVTALRGSSQ